MIFNPNVRKSTNKSCFRFLSMAILLSMSACGGVSQPAQFYAFGDARQVEAAKPSPTSERMVVFVAAVTVPEYLDRQQMVRRTPTQVVEISEQNRWAEPLKIGVGRVSANELATLLARPDRFAEVLAYPVNPIVEPQWRVTINILRLDITAGGAASFESAWTIRDQSGALRAGHSTFECQGSADMATAVGVWERMVRASASEIAVMLDHSVEPARAFTC